MAEFKGTKGNWELIEHNWSDSSIICGDNVICTNSIYEYATEENQMILESEMSANMLLISKAPEMLELLKDIKDYLGGYRREEVEQLIKEATEL